MFKLTIYFVNFLFLNKSYHNNKIAMTKALLIVFRIITVMMNLFWNIS